MFRASFTGLLTLSLIGFAANSLADSKKAKTDWRTQSHCVKLIKSEAPTMMTSRQIKFVGVDIGPEGQFIRLYPKADTLKSLPDNFVFADQAKLLNNMTRDDFYHFTGPFPADYETPLDIHSNDDMSFIYILMPKTWEFASPAMSLKVPSKKWKHPHVDMPLKALTPKVAIVHRQGLTTDTRLQCDYDFNLHVNIIQTENGRKFKTPIIIDPGLGNGDPSVP